MRRKTPAARPADRRPGPPARLRVSPVAATKAAHAGLWALLGLTLLAAVVALVRPPARATAAVRTTEPGLGAQGFAELYVAAYLSAGHGTEDSLRPFYPKSVDLRDVAPAGVYAGRTTALDAREVADRYWAVTVGVEVVYPQAGGLGSGGTRYYQVGVARVGEAYSATALPALVAAPATSNGPKLALASPQRPEGDDPVAAAVERFASAFLAGQGELARYTAPGSMLRPVRPAPFASVEVTGLSSRDTEPTGGPTIEAKEVLAEVRGTDSAGRVQVLGYALELASRAGRWEVTRLLPGPSLATTRRAPTVPTSQSVDDAASPTAPSTTSVVVAPVATASTVTTRQPERTSPTP